MRNLRKYFAVFVAVALLVAAIAPAFAADTADTAAAAAATTTTTAAPALSDSKVCETLGMLKGDGAGISDAYLKTTVTRLQAAIMFLRLKGLEDKALAFTGKDNFADVDKVEWDGGKAILGYLKANKDLGWQGDGTSFNPNGTITAQEYYKILLVSLGYVEGKDFKFEDTLTFAATKGLKAAAKVTTVTVNDVAAATVEALKANTADGKTTLIKSLVDAKIVDSKKAADSTLIAAPSASASSFDLTIKSAKSLYVKFNGPVADTTKAAITVTRDAITAPVALTATWDADKAGVVLSQATNLVAGDYKVAIKNDAADLGNKTMKVEAEKIAKIEMTSKMINRRSDTEGIAYYKVTNQYGDDVTANPIASNIQWNSSLGSKPDASKGTLVFTKNDKDNQQNDVYMGKLKDQKTVVVSAYDSDSNVVMNETLTVSDTIGDIQSIKLLGLSNVDKKTDIEKATSDIFYVDYEIKDSNGNLINDYGILNNTNAFILNPSSNSSIANVKVVQDPNDNKKAKFKVDVSGCTNTGIQVVTATSISTGKSASINIEVKEGAQLKEFVLQKPAQDVAQGDGYVEVPYIALDSKGNQITDYNKITALNNSSRLLQISGGNGIQEIRNPDGSYKLMVNFGNSKVDVTLNATVTTTTSVKMSTITVTVKDYAVPKTLVSINTNTYLPGLVYGASVGDKISNDAVIYDQYDRQMDLQNKPNAFTLTNDSDFGSGTYPVYYYLRATVNTSDINKINFGTVPAAPTDPTKLNAYAVQLAMRTVDTVSGLVYQQATYGFTDKILVYAGPTADSTTSANVTFDLVKATSNDLRASKTKVIDTKTVTFYNVNKKDISQYAIDPIATLFTANYNPNTVTVGANTYSAYTYAPPLVSGNVPTSGPGSIALKYDYVGGSGTGSGNNVWASAINIYGKYNGMKVQLADSDLIAVNVSDTSKFDARVMNYPVSSTNNDRRVWAKYFDNNPYTGTVTVSVKGNNGVIVPVTAAISSDVKAPEAQSITIGFDDPSSTGTGTATTYYRPFQQNGSIYRIKSAEAKRVLSNMRLYKFEIDTGNGLAKQPTRSDLFFTITDNYGKAAMNPTILINNLKDDGSASTATPTFYAATGYITFDKDPANGDVFTITALSGNGKSATVKIVIDDSIDYTKVY